MVIPDECRTAMQETIDNHEEREDRCISGRREDRIDIKSTEKYPWVKIVSMIFTGCLLLAGAVGWFAHLEAQGAVQDSQIKAVQDDQKSYKTEVNKRLDKIDEKQDKVLEMLVNINIVANQNNNLNKKMLNKVENR